MNTRDFAKKTIHAAIIATLGFSTTAYSADWICSNTDDWDNSSCWSTSAVPGAGEDAKIRTTTRAPNITVNYINAFTSGETLNEFILDASGTDTATLIRDVNISLNSSNVFIGQRGSGLSSVIHNAGSSIFDTGFIGAQEASNGYYELNNTGSIQWYDLYLGNRGNGEFSQLGGSNTINNNFQIGVESTGSGQYTLSDGTLTVNGIEEVGRWGEGSFVQNGGLHNVFRLHVARKAANGTYQLNSGDLNVSERLEIGTIPSSNGLFVQNGGNVIVAGPTVISGSGLATGKYELNGGILQTSIVENNDLFEHNGGQIIGDVVNNDKLRFTGNGTRLIQGSVINTGETTFIHDPQDNTGDPLIRTANGLIEIADGTTLNISEDLLLEDLGTFSMTLGDVSYGTTEFIRIDGKATLGGIFELNIYEDFFAEDGDIWTLFTASDIDGLFSQVIFNESYVDLDFSLAYNGTSVDLVAASVSAVPIPAAAWLFVSGLAGLITISRRRKTTFL